jgi:iron(III) transport system ATP-binding protein
VLSVNNHCARIGRDFAIEDISFSVGSGERIALLGPNGSGKTSLLRLIAGLETPRSGTISWSGAVLSSPGRVDVPPESRSMGILFQEGALFPHLDVRANVAVALPPGTSKSEGRPLVDRALEIARIRHLADRSVLAISGGEQQRAALARALVLRPAVLLLDEPCRSLDGPVKRQILAELRAIAQKENMATLLVTHETDEAAAFSDRVVLLRGGRMAQEGSFDDIYRHPADRGIADFLGPVQAIETDKARRHGLELPPGCEAPELFFRPEHLVLTAAPDSAAHSLRVVQVRAAGALQEVTVELPDGTELLSRVLAGRDLQSGQSVSGRIAATLSLPDNEELMPGNR